MNHSVNEARKQGILEMHEVPKGEYQYSYRRLLTHKHALEHRNSD